MYDKIMVNYVFNTLDDAFGDFNYATNLLFGDYLLGLSTWREFVMACEILEFIYYGEL